MANMTHVEMERLQESVRRKNEAYYEDLRKTLGTSKQRGYQSLMSILPNNPDWENYFYSIRMSNDLAKELLEKSDEIGVRLGQEAYLSDTEVLWESHNTMLDDLEVLQIEFEKFRQSLDKFYDSYLNHLEFADSMQDF